MINQTRVTPQHHHITGFQPYRFRWPSARRVANAEQPVIARGLDASPSWQRRDIDLPNSIQVNDLTR